MRALLSFQPCTGTSSFPSTAAPHPHSPCGGSPSRVGPNPKAAGTLQACRGRVHAGPSHAAARRCAQSSGCCGSAINAAQGARTTSDRPALPSIRPTAQTHTQARTHTRACARAHTSARIHAHVASREGARVGIAAIGALPGDYGRYYLFSLLVYKIICV